MGYRTGKFTDTTGWPERKIWDRVRTTREELGWDRCYSRARDWWATFERENKHRPHLVLRVCEELISRQATINDFFLSYVWSNTENIQGNLDFLDLVRLRAGSKKRRLTPTDFEFTVC